MKSGREAELLLLGILMADGKLRDACSVDDFWECADIAREVIGCKPGAALAEIAGVPTSGEKTRDALLRGVRERTRKRRGLKLFGDAWRKLGELRARLSIGSDPQFKQVESLREILQEIVGRLDEYEGPRAKEGTLPSVPSEEWKPV